MTNYINHHSNSQKKVSKNNIFFDWIMPILIAILIYWIVTRFLFFKINVPTPSMMPTVESGDQIFVTKIYNP